MSDWVVYTRDSCSLCESFIEDLAAWLGDRAAAVRLVDIAADAQLEARFGTKIPVLEIDGNIVCMYRLDTERLKAYRRDTD